MYQHLKPNQLVITHTRSDGTQVISGPSADTHLAYEAISQEVKGFRRTKDGVIQIQGSVGHGGNRRKIEAAKQALQNAGYEVTVFIDDLTPERPGAE